MKSRSYNKIKLLLNKYIYLIITIILWSSVFVGIRICLEHYSPAPLALLRFLIASILMLLFYFRKKHQFKPLKKNVIFKICGLGFLGIGCYNVMLNYGEQIISSGTAGFIISQSPVFTIILAVILLKERLRSMEWIGVFISILGVSMILISEQKTAQFNSGVIYILIAVLLSSIYFVWQKPLLQKQVSSLQFATLAIWGGTVPLFIFFPQLFEEILSAPLRINFSAIYLGVFPGALAQITWGIALTKLNVSHAGIYFYAMPISATFLGWLILGEIPLLLSLFGGIVAILGAIVVTYFHESETMSGKPHSLGKVTPSV